MKNLINAFLLVVLFVIPTISNAQLIDELFKKKDKAPKETPAAAKNKGEVVATDNIPVITDKKFSYKCYTLNTNIEVDEVKECVYSKGEKIITDMQYYEQGEDVRIKEKSNSTLVLAFLDDTKRLISISVEDIDDISLVKVLQQQVLDQMGNPTQGYEIMKNYDGSNNSAWADYSTYEFVYRYIFGTTAYDFRVTQYGAKSKNGKIIHPYSFKAIVSKKAEISSNPGETEVKTDFYPTTGAIELEGYTVETQMLRKW
jgi:hypothetical protein